MGKKKNRGIWTIEALKEYNDALRAADQRALAIKEQADQEALRIERETRSYKDEKANNLRDQLGSERGLYVTKSDLEATSAKIQALVLPLTDYVSTQRGQKEGVTLSTKILMGAMTVCTTLILAGLAVVGFFLAHR
jgi:vacuolar-type H+-ATPase subunit E/Vma4